MPELSHNLASGFLTSQNAGCNTPPCECDEDEDCTCGQRVIISYQ